MALYAPAIKKLIPPGPNDPRITPRVVILHIAMSEGASLHSYFNGPSGGVESHFYIRRDGTVEQYRDTAYQADANTDANNFAISIETQGMEYGEWTDAQMAAIKALILWCNKMHAVPLSTVKTWNGSGVGYHTQFPGSWDKRGATCPGPDRKRQFAREIVPWLPGAKGGAQSMPKPLRPTTKPKPVSSAKAPAFPLPRGSYFGPKSGGRESVSGYYSHRADLKVWQAQMRKRGWSITPDGLYGPTTASVARVFQKEKGLSVDGLIGHSTWAAAWTADVT